MNTDFSTALSLASGVCNAASSLINVFSSIHQIRKKELNELKLKIDAYNRAAYIHYAGDLFRQSIDEIDRTTHYIESKNLTGTALKCAMEQFEIFNNNLNDVIRSYRHM